MSNWRENLRRQQPVDYPIYVAVDNREMRRSWWTKALNIFVAGMGILGWVLLLLFLWVATP